MSKPTVEFVVFKIATIVSILFLLSIVIGTILTVIHRNDDKEHVIDEILVLTPLMGFLVILFSYFTYELVRQVFNKSN